MSSKNIKMPKLLTTTEMRKLIRAHNKLSSINIPVGSSRDDIIRIVKSKGFDFNHPSKSIIPTSRPRGRTISLPYASKLLEKKPLTKEQVEKKVLKEKVKKEVKDKEIKLIKKEAVKEFKIKKKEAIVKTKKKEVVVKVSNVKKPPVVKRDVNEAQVIDEFKKKPTDIADTYGKTGKVFKNPDIVKQPIKKENMKFKLKETKPSNVVIDVDKKPTKIDKSYEIIKVPAIFQPLDVTKYKDIRNIPTGEIFKNILINRNPIFYPWSSADIVSDLLLITILKDNKNFCSLERYVSKAIKKVDDNVTKSKKGKVTVKRRINVNKRLVDEAYDIARRVIKCSIKKYATPIPLRLQVTGDDDADFHANLLLFNPRLMTVEHFEPHGRYYMNNFKPKGINLTPAIKEINETIQYLVSKYKDEKDMKKYKDMFGTQKWKYLKPIDICPTEKDYKNFRGFQASDSYGHSGTPQQFKGVTITEMGGYCAMWSYYYLDLRLKTLKKPAKTIVTEITKLFEPIGELNKIERSRFIQLMRGWSAYAYTGLLEFKNSTYFNKEFTERDLIIFLDNVNWKEGIGITKERHNNLYFSLDDYILNEYKKLNNKKLR